MRANTKMIKFILIFSIIVLSGRSVVFADSLAVQDEKLVQQLKNKPLNGFFGLTFSNVVPQNEFYKNLRSAGPGLSLYGGYAMDPIPVAFGLETDLQFFSGDEKTFSYKNNGGWTVYRDTVSSTTMSIPITAFVRLQPKMNFVTPFFETFFGVNIMTSSADYSGGYDVNGNRISDSKNKTNAAFTYGVGAGCMFKLVDFVQLPNSYTNLNLDIRVRYMFGSKSKYSTIKLDDNTAQPIFTDYKSKTDMLMTSIGISFRF